MSFKSAECVFGNRFSHIPEKIEIEIEVMNGVQPHGGSLSQGRYDANILLNNFCRCNSCSQGSRGALSDLYSVLNAHPSLLVKGSVSRIPCRHHAIK